MVLMFLVVPSANLALKPSVITSKVKGENVNA